MGFLRRLAFYLGLALGLATIAAAGAAALTYLFTGKFPFVELSGEKRRATLLTADEVVALIREQVDKAKAAHLSKATGGEGNVHA